MRRPVRDLNYRPDSWLAFKLGRSQWLFRARTRRAVDILAYRNLIETITKARDFPLKGTLMPCPNTWLSSCHTNPLYPPAPGHWISKTFTCTLFPCMSSHRLSTSKHFHAEYLGNSQLRLRPKPEVWDQNRIEARAATTSRQSIGN